MTVIDANGLVKRYRTGDQTLEALKGIDFRLDAGEFVSIMGPSGSGKTTLLNILGLLSTPTEGRVLLDGRDVTDLGDRKRTHLRKRTIGFVFLAVTHDELVNEYVDRTVNLVDGLVGEEALDA